MQMLFQPQIDLTVIPTPPSPQRLSSPIHIQPRKRLAPISELGEQSLEGHINVDALSFDRTSSTSDDDCTSSLSTSTRPQTPSTDAHAMVISTPPRRKVSASEEVIDLYTPSPRRVFPNAKVIGLITPPPRRPMQPPKSELINLSLSPLRPSVKRKHQPLSPATKKEPVVLDLCSPPRSKSKMEPKTETLGRRSVVVAPGAIKEGNNYSSVELAIDDIYYHEEQRGYKWALAQVAKYNNGALKKRTVRCNHYREPGSSKHLLHLDPSDHRSGKTVRTNCMARVNINRSAETGVWRLTAVNLDHNDARLIPEGGVASRPPTQAHKDVVAEFAHESFSRNHISTILKSDQHK